MNEFNITMILLFASTTLWSADLAEPSRNNSYWQCSAVDSDNKHWVAKSQYERTATHKAWDACKKESRVPLSCNMSQANCTAIIQGVSTRAMWQCTALDKTAKPWRGRFYTNPDDAALGAKAFCKKHSSMPDTCYIRLITCKNRNEL